MGTPNTWIYFERFVMLATMIGIIIGVLAYLEEREARNEARLVNSKTLAEFQATSEERKVSTRLRAWEILTRPASGVAGKDWALTYLHSIGENLSGLNLSCDNLGIPKTKRDSCGAKFEFLEMDLRNATMRNSNFSGIGIHITNFERAAVSYSDFSHTTVSGSSFDGADLGRSTFKSANIYGVNFNNAHISLTDFSDSHYSDDSKPTFTNSWAWSDELPKGLQGFTIFSCEPVFRNGIRHSGMDMRSKTRCTPVKL